MNNFFIGILTHPAINIVTAAIGFLLGHWFTQHRNLEVIRITEYNRGAAAFRDAFTDIVHTMRDSGLEPKDEGWYYLLREMHTVEVDISIHKAKIKFEPYLTAKELKGFNVVWTNYTEWLSHFQKKDYQENPPDFLSHINALLEYAKPK